MRASSPGVPRTAVRLAVCALALLPLLPEGAAAQRSRDRHERERAEREREQRERERERRAREQRERHERDWQVRIERVDRTRRGLGDERWERPRASVGAGLDFRRFGTDGRYLAQGGVDFRSRSGLGLRPEVLFGWSAAPEPATGGPGATVLGRSRMLGIALSGTYTFAQRSPVRPYVLSGVGMFSTRLPRVDTPVPGQGRATIPARTVLDAGLTAGAGLELSLGPVRLFAELRYLLLDGGAGTAGSPGFAGMLPLTAGIRF